MIHRTFITATSTTTSLSPGASYTLEYVYGGSGNLNKTAGDWIYHCHFYPHFAGGMWAMWRNHDVFEMGTIVDATGKPTTDWNRALPDGEIATGTPIPALVPLPTLAMAPMPARVKIARLTKITTRIKRARSSARPARKPRRTQSAMSRL
jgi:hypothetical protein